jgi:hypothetical protein
MVKTQKKNTSPTKTKKTKYLHKKKLFIGGVTGQPVRPVNDNTERNFGVPTNTTYELGELGVPTNTTYELGVPTNTTYEMSKRPLPPTPITSNNIYTTIEDNLLNTKLPDSHSLERLLSILRLIEKEKKRRSLEKEQKSIYRRHSTKSDYAVPTNPGDPNHDPVGLV